MLDTPGPVDNLRVHDVAIDSVTLKWEAPLNDGGSIITNYIVQKKESSRKSFVTVDKDCERTSCKIKNLSEGSSYFFKYIFHNKMFTNQQYALFTE